MPRQRHTKQDKNTTLISETERTPFSVVPDEILIEIFKNFNHLDLTAVKAVCKKWYDIISEEYSDSPYGKLLRFKNSDVLPTIDKAVYNLEGLQKTLSFSNHHQFELWYIIFIATIYISLIATTYQYDNQPAFEQKNALSPSPSEKISLYTFTMMGFLAFLYLFYAKYQRQVIDHNDRNNRNKINNFFNQEENTIVLRLLYDTTDIIDTTHTTSTRYCYPILKTQLPAIFSQVQESIKRDIKALNNLKDSLNNSIDALRFDSSASQLSWKEIIEPSSNKLAAFLEEKWSIWNQNQHDSTRFTDHASNVPRKV